MTVLDVVLVLSALGFAVSGYRRGLLVGVLSFAGFLGGGAAGMLLAPRVVGGREPGVTTAVFAVVIVVVAALVGQALLSALGTSLRQGLTWSPLRAVDGVLGAAVTASAVLVLAWFVAIGLRQAPLPGVSRQVADSRVLAAVDTVLPDGTADLFGSFVELLDERGFPRVFNDLGPERITPVDPPASGAAATVGVRAAGRSVVEIVGDARACRRRVEGTGFVYAPGRVMTNAHVVGGVTEPMLRVGGTGRAYRAQVVAFDPRRDLAVLAVPGLPAPALRFDRGGSRGDAAVVAGFPRGGPYRLDAARIREEIRARGQDIYGRSAVTREVFSIRGRVEPGNSGGPLLSPAGGVYGVVFAKSLDDPSTGYALTVDEAAPVADSGRRATGAVDTGRCA